MTIETYPEMNDKIVELLRICSDDPSLLYAAQRIEELEAEVERLQRRYDSLRIRFDATQRVLTRTLNENRVKDECLALAMVTLRRLEISTTWKYVTIRTLAVIEQRLARLELEEETG